ncbi:TM2 domain-containing protein [Nocardioides sp. GY 10113]|uniref:TM2 domain-containing protein n=1 Tax=Nocardioides sp. GY 10113 TaxID=2569761 RepID=UPI0010A87123|nr:TM2 domain-containing protein [Nocardioides sp. GY 10113]TIC84857.1 TM2 domain-containing protein [Nocardioides sp. GY 10113]
MSQWQPGDPEPGEQRYLPYGQPMPPGPNGQPPAAYPVVHAPYGIDPISGLPLSDKSKVVAGVLQLVLSLFSLPGIGRLYAGNVGIGLTQLLGTLISLPLMCAFIGFATFPAFILWGIVDGIVMLASATLRDGNGRIVR